MIYDKENLMIKLLAIDLDGTLLNNQGQISQANRQALNRVRQQGVNVVLCTGRPYLYMKNLVDDLGFKSERDYIITFNGGQVQKAADGEIVEAFTLSKNDLERWHQEMMRLNLPLNAIDGQYVYDLVDHPVEPQSWYLKERPTIASQQVSMTDFDLDHVFNKLVISCEPAVLDERLLGLEASLADHYSYFKSHENLFEVVAKGVNKGNIVKRLAERLEIPLEQVMTIGDQENDKSMIEIAGIGVAMGNAIDAVKEVADYVTATNDQDGVAQAINQFIA